MSQGITLTRVLRAMTGEETTASLEPVIIPLRYVESPVRSPRDEGFLVKIAGERFVGSTPEEALAVALSSLAPVLADHGRLNIELIPPQPTC
jgi:hypothetical protein